MWTGDGDYDTWGRFVFTGVAIGLITLPIWILPYGIWYIFKGHKEEQKRKLEEIERKKKFDEYIKKGKITAKAIEKFASTYYLQIIEKWTQFYLLKMEPKNEKITRKIK